METVPDADCADVVECLVSFGEDSDPVVERCQSWERDDAERLSFGRRDGRREGGGAPSLVVNFLPLPVFMLGTLSDASLCSMVSYFSDNQILLLLLTGQRI